jgi:alpha-aminoadipate/glutamate carrier protein LysW
MVLFYVDREGLGYTEWSARSARRVRLTFPGAVYNTPGGRFSRFRVCRAKIKSEDGAVLRCPECSAEIDVDEDEVEEGEILSCPECETELEVSQTHPVALNPISDELEEEDEDELEEDEDEFDEDGDLPDEDDDEDDDDEDE